ncbi:MAG: GlsB/YeaQ/YmgE family stress response membrane protein [Saprospiraceae bacterium]
MDILTWAILGLIAGALAKFIMPGRDSGGLISTIIIGVIGSIVGGYVFNYFGWGGSVTGINTGSIITSVVGALICLFVYRRIS